MHEDLRAVILRDEAIPSVQIEVLDRTRTHSRAHNRDSGICFFRRDWFVGVGFLHDVQSFVAGNEKAFPLRWPGRPLKPMWLFRECRRINYSAVSQREV